MELDPKYVVVTPVRDEVSYIERTIASMSRQTLPPKRWVIVDDGSTDGTREILDMRAAAIPWLTVTHRGNRGFRAAGGGVVEAFYAGFSLVQDEQWDFVVKLDGDLSFEPSYFERCFAIFRAEKRLGIGGGTVCHLVDGRPEIDAAGDPPFHVRGATKIYRRECWDAIAPLIRAPGWDTVDEVKANLHGWTTRTFSDITLMQHKPTGGADGAWRNSFKNGLANYISGYHPLFMLAKCARRALRWPPFAESAALLAGFASGYLNRVPQVDDAAAIRYLREQQMRRLLLRPSIYG